MDKFLDEHFPTIDEIIKFVREYVKEECQGEYPEDEWYGLEVWDINMTTDEGVKYATLYPVQNNNNVDSSRGVVIKIP